MRLKPKNWSSFQHYKDRSPPWIKLHKSLLDDRAFISLPIASKALAPLLWLLASESKDGEFNAATEELAFRLRLSDKEIIAGIKPLIEKGFFVNASKALAGASNSHTSAVPEERRGETEAEAEGKEKPNARGTRLPADWKIPEDWKTEAKRIRPDWHDQHIERIADSFRDYWVAKTGQGATKADWLATWRNWCRNDRSTVYPGPQGQPPLQPKPPARKPMPTTPERQPKPEGVDLGQFFRS